MALLDAPRGKGLDARKTTGRQAWGVSMPSCTISLIPNSAPQDVAAFLDDGDDVSIFGSDFGATEGAVKLWENANRTGTSIDQTVVSWADDAITFTAETTAFGHSVNTIVYVDVIRDDETEGGGVCLAPAMNVVAAADKGRVQIINGINEVSFRMLFSFGGDNSKGVYIGLASGNILDVTDLLPAPKSDPVCQCIRRFTSSGTVSALITYSQNDLSAQSCPPDGVDCSGTDIGDHGWIANERAVRFALEE